jgi:hypothetical protein
MKQKLKLLITIPLILLLFKACKPEEGCVDNNYYEYQLEEYLNSVPYKDFSELTFINKTNRDTFVFIGQGYVYDWGKYTTQEECPQTYNLQRRYIVFNCTKNTDKIIVENTFEKPGISAIKFSYKNYGKSLSYGSFFGPYHHDSILIENKIYYKVRDLTKTFSTAEFGFLFSKNEGLIRLINSSTNDTLNLIDIKL